ncbi:pseudouridine-5'-phosphate glycosidase [Candidatus Uabimicrobium amorphum]|uniref:Pseudouridine-5'-phosphate glycosidase n=1 Tax=Uabimicrobium amorphum TaxID=2596890 RepID=A0A5S9IWC7_UABAM|nr:pseudouridine-5'-phosphate glycosidase [Candidatus Uabimicrobium amorphum]BBM88290.1 pseudouridine-5'-phosphate glycosidase [Candidatus Uabimicrobium amorphum]
MIEYSKEVRDALRNDTPIVALESTIIAFGMPYPQNLSVAQQVESTVRSCGVTPATIAVVEGKIKVGLTAEELNLLATSDEIIKASSKDLAYLMATKKNGATTVASTARCARMANIAVFATGGIGGVHRGVNTTFDISADLLEMKNNSVAIVCAGMKSILDVEKTIEQLETLSILALGYQCDTWPLFYSRDSHYDILRVDSCEEIASVMHCKWNELQQQEGLVIANPIAQEQQIPYETIDGYIKEISQQVVQQKITGKKITPFFLQEIVKKTKGKSLEANISLVINNAKLAAQIAKEYAVVKNHFAKNV